MVKGALLKAQENIKALHSAVKHNNEEEVKNLLNKGVNVNAKDDDRCTPLHLAAREGCEDVVKTLIAKGANVNAEGIVDETPLHLAARGAIKM
ncbi:ankyrin repeat domain-containing protein [Wolbachia endosymbiont of Zaprionus tsacasi]|uniref:ankyrin repeat domain-containing protein n=1 Tax=Wolbachia endosymbiont of Zaprionus tsacasi TaxID=2603209 RepID=UPI002937107E|nr:ankyrin repeat domain-containing protein [Wolbachia endosymbiont of Zaprionus tsacasi]WOE64065.1 ankyrin repeat domain-containing protein [Wolbachia endosymbiont of Zaprionus tsacasi]